MTTLARKTLEVIDATTINCCSELEDLIVEHNGEYGYDAKMKRLYSEDEGYYEVFVFIDGSELLIDVDTKMIQER